MIPIAKPFLGEEEAAAAYEAVRSGWVTQGPKVKAFEDAFGEYVGSAFAVAVSNCTVALHLSLLAVGVKPGDVVVTVSHSFIATANAIRYCGAEPVFVDIESDTYNMDPRDLERFLFEECEERADGLYYGHAGRLAKGESPLAWITGSKAGQGRPLGRVAAVLAVHQMGRPCDIGSIVSLALRHGIRVVEDAACAIGSAVAGAEKGGKAAWERIGRPHGDVACFSFHPRKVITTGEGGMVTTDNPAYAEKLRLLRQHGMTVPDTVRHAAREVIFEEYAVTGFNYRMTDIQAAIGIVQLTKLDTVVEERRRIAAHYEDLLKDIPFLDMPLLPVGVRSNWQSYPVRLAHDAPFDQREVMSHLLSKDISTRRGIMNAHQEAPYAAQGWNLPKSEEARDRAVLIPFFNGISEEEMERVALTMKDYCRR